MAIFDDTQSWVSIHRTYQKIGLNKIFEVKIELLPSVLLSYRDLCKIPLFAQFLRLPRRSGRSYWGRAQILILEVLNVFLPAL